MAVSSLDLSGNSLSEEDCTLLEDAILSCPTLTALDIVGNPAHGSPSALRLGGIVAVHELRRLTLLDGGLDSCFRSVSDRGLGDIGVVIVAEHLGEDAALNGLCELGLHYNNLGDPAGIALGKALLHFTWTMILNLNVIMKPTQILTLTAILLKRLL